MASLSEQVYKILRKHTRTHLVYPLIIGLFLEIGSEQLIGMTVGHSLEWYWTVMKLGIVVLSVLTTYAFVLWRLQKNDAKYVYTSEIRNVLKANLKDATRFFAISIGEIDRWFVPSSLMYFLDLLTFDTVQERIFVFLDESQSHYDDDINQGPSMANVLSILHTQANINHACLSPRDFNEILQSLDKETKRELKITPTLLGYLRSMATKRPSRKKVRYWKKRIHLRLDFAYVEKPPDKNNASQDCVLLTNKQNKPDKIKKKETVEAYKKFVEAIEKKIYVEGTTDIDESYKFSIKGNLVPEEFSLVRFKQK